MNRRLFTLGTLAGGITAAAFIGVSAAQADDTYVYTLGPEEYFGPSNDGGGNISTGPFKEILTGNSYIEAKDVTTGTSVTEYDLYGNGTETLNPYTGAVEHWNLIETNPASDLVGSGLTVGSQIDVTEFGSGFANQVVDIPAATAGAMNTITDTLITPFGDYTLFSF